MPTASPGSALLGDPGPPSAVGMNICPLPRASCGLEQAPCEGSARGGFAGQERAGHRSGCPQGAALCLQSQVLNSVPACSWGLWTSRSQLPLLFSFSLSSLLVLCTPSTLTTLCLAISYLLARCRHSLTIIDIHGYESPNGPSGFNSLPCSDFVCVSPVSRWLPIPCFFLDRWLLGFFPVPAHSSLPPSLTCIPASAPILGSSISRPPITLASSFYSAPGACHWSRGSPGPALRAYHTTAMFSVDAAKIVKHPVLVRMCLVSAEDTGPAASSGPFDGAVSAQTYGDTCDHHNM